MKAQRCLIHVCTGLGAASPLLLHAATAPLTGGDAGQGLTINSAQYLKGLNLGTATARTVQGAVFNGTPAAGFTVTGLGGFAAPFTGTFGFGAGETSANDTALAELTRTLYFGGGGIDVTISALTPGTSYQLNLIQSVTTSFGPREQAILLNGAWQENVMLTQGNNAKVTTLVATANASGQIALGLRPSGSYGGTGAQDGAVLSGIAVTTIPNPDSDNDQLLDVWEYGYFPGDLTKLSGSADFDSDGATDKKEYDSSTNPTDPDSDDDGLSDGAELNRLVGGNPAPTNPNSKDSDGDGLYDNEETGTGIYINAQNTGSNPLAPDSDGDGTKDQIEILLGSDPNNASSVPTGHAASPLVALDATALPAGTLSSWANAGLLGRSFNAVSATPPEVVTLQGVKGVKIDGLPTSLSGPPAPSILNGGSSRTVEAWIYNPAIANEETIVSWARRDGPDGTHSSFIHGTNATFGAFGGWGPAADLGWGTVPAKAGRWTHVAYTYDSTSKSFRVYNDGVLASEEINTLNSWATDLAGNPLPIRIGAQNGSTGVLVAPAASMTIAKLLVHDYALSASELKNNDSDLDGLPDFYESFYGLNPNSAADAAADGDGDGVSSLIEYRMGTNPVWANPDTDNDGLFDEWELANFRDPNANPPETDEVVLAKFSGSGALDSDPDGDDFSNREEFLGGSNPNDAASLPTDQDGDSMADAWEIQHFGSIAGAKPFDDNDNDGVFNIDEFLGSTGDPADWATDASDPKNERSQPDTDGNGLGDGWEYTYGTGPGSMDPLANTDGDGINNLAEYAALTDPNKADTDGDGLNDDVELNRTPAATNPRSKDSDNDRLSDGVETGTGIYVSRANTGSNPLATDSDGDGSADAMEVARGSDPNQASSTPPSYGLMARWKMNETSGTAVPSIPDATLTGQFANLLSEPVTMAWQSAQGIEGALQRSADADRVEIPALDTAYGFTAMGWIKPSGTQPLWARLITSRFQNGFFLGRDGGTNLWKFIVNDNFTLVGPAILADQWQHVCGTYDGTTARLYLNGVEVAAKAMPAPTVPLQPVFFGSEGGAERGFTGLMDEFKIYSGPMPASEISNLYASESVVIGNLSPYDTWATGFGLDPAGNGAADQDPDHDGTLNGVEYALGLSPVDARSVFAATLAGTPATGITLTWPSKPGVSFQVRSGTDLGSFPTLEATVPGATAPATSTTWSSGPLTPSAKKFYRVEFTP